MTEYERGVEDEQARIVALLDTYEITELRGGVIMLRPEQLVKQPGVSHVTGSLAGYYRKGCRCDACKGVAREWREQRLESFDDDEKLLKRNRKTDLQRQRRIAKAVSA